MPNHQPEAIANEFLRRYPESYYVSQVVLQKLVYIAHGWSLAITGQPLVRQSAEAWDNVLRQEHLSFGWQQISIH